MTRNRAWLFIASIVFFGAGCRSTSADRKLKVEGLGRIAVNFQSSTAGRSGTDVGYRYIVPAGQLAFGMEDVLLQANARQASKVELVRAADELVPRGPFTGLSAAEATRIQRQTGADALLVSEVAILTNDWRRRRLTGQFSLRFAIAAKISLVDLRSGEKLEERWFSLSHNYEDSRRFPVDPVDLPVTRWLSVVRVRDRLGDILARRIADALK